MTLLYTVYIKVSRIQRRLTPVFAVRWLGHASFMIETPNGEHLLFDPVKEQFDSPVDLAFKLAGGMYRSRILAHKK